MSKVFGKSVPNKEEIILYTQEEERRQEELERLMTTQGPDDQTMFQQIFMRLDQDFNNLMNGQLNIFPPLFPP